MSRGIPSRKAFAAAVVAGKVRGQIIFLRPYPGSVCDFLIVTPTGIVAVCVRRTRRIRAGLAEIVEVFHETLNRIRAADHCTGVICEFWLWCPDGRMRFFALDGSRLIELSMYGLPLAPGVTGPMDRAPAQRAEAPEKNPAGPEILPQQSAGTAAGPAHPAAAPSTAPPGRPAQSEPPYIRFLRRRNAEIRRTAERPGAAGSTPPSPAPHSPTATGEGGLPTEKT